MAQNIARLLQLDDCLRRIDVRRTALALAIELEVSERKVRYDLDLLRERLHAPIANSRALGYHYTDLSWRLSTIPLTQGELFYRKLLTTLLHVCQPRFGSMPNH